MRIHYVFKTKSSEAVAKFFREEDALAFVGDRTCDFAIRVFDEKVADQHPAHKPLFSPGVAKASHFPEVE